MADDPGRTDRHQCPCGCRTLINDEQVACAAGWRRIPAELRGAVAATYQDRQDHRQAREAAGKWLEEHRTEGADDA